MSYPRYDPSVFICPDEDAAKRIILTPEAGLTSEERWQRETDWLLPRLDFTGARVILDYGCGIGRLAKELCIPVLGVDISLTMRQMALAYTRRSNFSVATPEFLGDLVGNGFIADGALAIWALQHVLDLPATVELISSVLRPEAPLYVVNRPERYVPVSVDDGKSFRQLLWANDGGDVMAALADGGFEFLGAEEMPPELCQQGALFSRWKKR